jgi:hypothetical protein
MGATHYDYLPGYNITSQKSLVNIHNVSGDVASIFRIEKRKSFLLPQKMGAESSSETVVTICEATSQKTLIFIVTQ